MNRNLWSNSHPISPHRTDFTCALLSTTQKICSLLIYLLGSQATAQIAFTDKTAVANIQLSAETWGANWADINNDFYPDLLISNHRGSPSLYLNNRDGTFTETGDLALDSSTLNGVQFYDKHGASFADFDNDGDTDLFFRTGSAYRNLLYINENGTFTEKGMSHGIGDTRGGKSATVIDYNNDGLLDILAGEQNWMGTGNAHFSDANFEIEKTCNPKVNAVAISDYNNDGSLEIICVIEGEFPQNIFATNTLPFKTRISDLPLTSLVNNFAIGDFDGDLDTDFILTRGFLRPTEATLITPNRLEAWLQSGPNTTRGFSFISDGNLTITSDSNFFKNAFDIYVGETEIKPFTTGNGGESTFSVEHDATEAIGLSDNTGNNRLHVGRINNRWHIETPASSDVTRGYIVVESSANISDILTYGTGVGDQPISNALLINENNVFTDKATDFGLSAPLSCVSVAAADFDNDMDLDLYLACTTSTQNLKNRLYENMGNETYTEILSHGAEGAIGKGLEAGAGTADSALLADYDLDGYIDIAVTNGLGLRPLHQGGPHQLFRNTTHNSNHWIELRPVGTASNRDGFGAKIIATSNGVSQLRELHQNNQRWGHHDKTIHFGLAQNTSADITVQWPNGTEDSYVNLQSDNFYTLTQDGVAELITPGPIGPNTANNTNRPDSGGGGCSMSAKNNHDSTLEWLLILSWFFYRFSLRSTMTFARL